MIVDDLDRMGPVVTPNEDNAPLAVDPDRVLARSVATQRLKPVAGRETEVLQVLGRVEGREFAARRVREVACHAPRQPAGEDQ